MTLQNHPGEVEFPVRARVRYARMLDAQRLRPGGGKGTRALLVTALALPFGAAGVALGILVATSGEPEGGPAMPIVLFALGMGIGMLVASIVFQQIDARAPRRDQLDYVAQARIRPVTLEEQQLLALDAVSDYSFGGWNSSLAFQPTWAEMPAELRTTHADGANGHEWVGLPMTTLAQHRAALDTQFRIASRDDIELFVADALTQGPQSARFAELAVSEEAERMVSRMAALTGRSEFEIIDLTRPHDGRPPVLLLAGDSERTIGAIRYAYMAGYLPADDAWALIRQIGARVFATYDGWDAYWADVSLALAFRTDSLDAVQSQRRVRDALVASAWPAATVPWPGAATPRS
ncbi:DUF1266 domain-containing protein [Clavibacter michiganensis subsp. michiganensis]|uniref:DUF1266 domain-containing protein n=1 Tax=Clavibacter michiganensis subsp. michiganensis (strain NCPPB 382) TaxID=443906 RepID=A5CUH0_CLAM3|nr:DUF1266 domain-containing protein [Clavibacter michiganensis]MWJ80341.1 DUF1266 domain-containing protein [Clavibacter michiganensis subsp. michiganensis]CAN02757.1 conserved hypothetical protein [Clavibacter michiganensis subsp. michiganensis NCPPB 382]